MRRLLALAAVVQAILVSVAHATTIDVTTTDDVLAADGHCSLREAVRSTNLDAAQFGGAGECAAGNLADTVQLPAGHFTLSIPGNDNAAADGDLDILAELTINGAGAGATIIDGGGIDRVLTVVTGVATTLQGLTITGGKAPDGTVGSPDHGTDGIGGNASGGNAGPGQRGGGILSSGALTITDCAIVENHAGNGGQGGNATGGYGSSGSSGGSGGTGLAGRGGSGADGGGIAATGSLTLTRVLVQGNRAGNGGNGGNGVGGQGGGAGTTAGGDAGSGFGGDGGGGGTAGGILHGGAPMVIRQSEISGNSAGAGGAGGGGTGGLGGPGQTFGGFGGTGYGGQGGDAGDAGGLEIDTIDSIRESLLTDNHAGDGGNGGTGTGGDGEAAITGNAGGGGNARGGDGGKGGAGGAMFAFGSTITNTTLAANDSGDGGNAGNGTGGDGDNSGGGGSRGNGGNGDGGGGGAGGPGGAIFAYQPITAQHTTITTNGLGQSKPGGIGTGGAKGNVGTGGTDGTGTNGASPVSPQGGAVARTSQTSTLRASIMAGNTSPACTAGVEGDANISFGDASCPGANADPLLGLLADNGGFSFTRRPGDGSPAIDNAPLAGCATTDQRGAARPFGAGCDIGAYERAAPLVAITTAAATVQGTVNPNARPATYHIEYGTTGDYGSATTDVSVPGGVDPVAISATLDGLAPNTAYHVRLVATNADGSSASNDATFTTGANPPGGDTTAPVILSASVKPKKLKARRGTTLRYRLSEDARVVVTIQKRKGKRFGKPKRVSKTSKKGANKKKLATRKLKPGRYRATLVATDAAGNRSKAKRLTFRIVR